MYLYSRRHGDERFGTGPNRSPPVIILHGLFGSHRNWQGIASRLAEQFPVYTVDLRNHGESPHSMDGDYGAMAADIAEFFQAHDLRAAHVIGHSMGGKVAMQFAALHPSLVDKLVIVDVAPKPYPPHHRDIIAALQALDLRQIHDRTTADAALTRTIPDPATRQFLLAGLRCDAHGTCHWQFGLDELAHNYDALSQDITINHPYPHPTLFLRGGQSSYVADDDLPHIRTRFPAAQFATIPNAGHWVHIDAPAEFVRAVMEFLLSGQCSLE